MKKLFLLLLIPLMACGPTKNAIKAEEAYYNAKVQMAQRVSSQPIFEMTAADTQQPIVLWNVSALRVFQLPMSSGDDKLTQYIQKDHAQPWINAFLQSLGIIAPWAGVAILTTNVANAFRDVAVQPNSVTTTSTSTSITTRGAGNNAAIGGNVVTSTATPFIVDPVIVSPVIVP